MSRDESRLAVVESQVNTIIKDQDEMKKEINSINKHIWMAMGAVGAISVIVQLLFKH